PSQVPSQAQARSPEAQAASRPRAPKGTAPLGDPEESGYNDDPMEEGEPADIEHVRMTASSNGLVVPPGWRVHRNAWKVHSDILFLEESPNGQPNGHTAPVRDGRVGGRGGGSTKAAGENTTIKGCTTNGMECARGAAKRVFSAESALTNIDVLGHLAMFLEVDDLCQVKATCKALGSRDAPAFDGLSMVEEVARHIFESASDEEKQCCRGTTARAGSSCTTIC
ncbi:hypothetical protein THAOC_17509, partial [Thalassiosira oceanica]